RLGLLLHDARGQEREPEGRAEEREHAEGADALEQVLEVLEGAVARVVRPRRAQALDAPDGVGHEREGPGEGRDPTRGGGRVQRDVRLPRLRALEGGEVVPDVDDRPDRERSEREERSELAAYVRERAAFAGGGGRGFHRGAWCRSAGHAEASPTSVSSCLP